MSKILIVDDNKNNRMILSLMLEDYCDEHEDISFDIKEAVDGLDAVDICTKENFDIIFMDIMMPKMDGIEATKAIRALKKEVMIIAVSAVDDAERQKMILSNGAEDYISKPINADIFLSRIENYLSLIKSRYHVLSKNEETVNIYTKKIFSRQLTFMVKNEDALSEFWEYYLLNDQIKIDNLSDVVRSLFSLGELQLRFKQNFSIIVEENEDDLYLTMTPLGNIDQKLIKLVMAKNKIVQEYKILKESISFKLEKNITLEEIKVVSAIPTEKIETPSTVETTAVYVKKEESVEVYDYMDGEDLLEIEEYVSKLNSLLLMVGSGEISSDEVYDISSNLEKIARIMGVYNETYSMGQSLQFLAQAIEEHASVFMEISSDIGPMCAAFSIDLDNWRRLTFHEGASSYNFMDDTIIANTQTIASMLIPTDAVADDSLDDIFDF